MSEAQKNSIDNIQVIRGCPFPKAPWFTEKNIEDAMDYVPKDGDIIITSYPKTGSTWLQYIALQIISKGESFPAFDDTILKVVPFIELAGIAALETIESKPRIYKHHIAYNMVQKNDKSKCIYVYRNPEDTVVSFYHFMRSLKSEGFDQIDFNQYFDGFVAGHVGYGNYFTHVLSFFQHREDENLLMVSYEKMHSNKREEILRIAKFLGEDYHQCLLENDRVFNKVLEHTTFEYMQKNLCFTHPDIKLGIRAKSEDETKVDFFRKGIVGDGKTILTEDQRERLKEAAQKVLNGTSVIDEWYSK